MTQKAQGMPWPEKLHPEIIAACVGGGVTCDQIEHIYNLIRCAMSLHHGADSAVTSTERRCQKCEIPTGGEEASVDGQIWCHPCADTVSPPSTDGDKELER